MGISTAILLGSAVLLQLGCAGNVTTTALSPDALKQGNSVRGVVFYPPDYFKLTYAFSARVDKEGKLLGTADDGKCTASGAAVWRARSVSLR